jgi:hypothetical protein
MGLLLRVCTAMQRVERRRRSSLLLGDDDLPEDRFLHLLEYFSAPLDLAVVRDSWTASALLTNSTSLSKKASNLSLPLMRKFDCHPLLPPALDGGFSFSSEFLSQVAQYHQSLSRPEGVFADKAADSEELALLTRLAAVEREDCPGCNGRKQVYCGACGGTRLPIGGNLLPPRLADLPFDVLLLVHWQESLHKCTGVHASALCQEGCCRFLQSVPASYCVSESSVCFR